MQLTEGTYYTDQFFKEGIKITENNTPLSDDNIESFDSDEKYSHYVEALQWLEFKQEEITGMMYAAKQMSVKEGVCKNGSEGKESALREINNLTDNDCFGETKYEKQTQEQKDRALPIMMFMVLKSTGITRRIEFRQ